MPARERRNRQQPECRMPNSTNGCPAKVGFQFPKCFGRGWQSRGFCPNSPHNACRLGQRDEKRKAAGGQHRNNCAATCRIVARIPDHAPLRRRPVKTSGIKIALSPRCTNEVFVMPQPYDPYDLNDSGFSARRPCSLEKTVATGLDRKKGARRRPFVISNNQKTSCDSDGEPRNRPSPKRSSQARRRSRARGRS